MTKQETTSKNEFSIPLRVYIEDTDAGGIVYYVNYLKFMERARTEFMRSLGFEQQLSKTSTQQFVVHSADVKFVKPARMDMMLDVGLAVKKVANSYFVVEQKVRDESKSVLFCSADVKVACIDNETFKPKAMPAFVNESLKKFLA
jgi:tol-pal system-associated acyl-CoA thioesterase